MARTDDVSIRLRLLGARDVVRGTGMAGRSLSGMTKKIDKVGARSVLMAQGLESGRRGISAIGSALKYTGYAFGAFAAIEIPRALNAFRESEKAQRNVETAIRSTGGAANVSAKEIAALSEEMMLKVGVDDEEIKNAAAMILTFKNIKNVAGENNAMFDRTLQTTADLAARFGSDMPNAAKQLSKALNDPEQALSALRRSGVSFTDEQTEMISKWFENGQKLRAQKFIMKELAEQTRGAAASQADSVDVMKMKWGELEEQIGAGLFPLFEDLADLAGEVVDEVSAILDNKKLTGEQKFDRVMNIVDRVVGEGIERLDDYLPQMAEVGAGLGGRLAVSVGRAFLKSDIWGKLFIGAWIWKVLLGSRGSLVLAAVGKSVGKKLGKAILTALLPTLAAEFAITGSFGLMIKNRWHNLGKWASRMMFTGMIVGAVTLGLWLGKELSNKLSERTKNSIRQWGINAGENFVNALIWGVNKGIDAINDALDKANALSILGVDAPEIDRIDEVDLSDAYKRKRDGLPDWAPPGAGNKITNTPRSGRSRGRGARQPRIYRGGGDIVIRNVIELDGKAVAESTARHAAAASALA